MKRLQTAIAMATSMKVIIIGLRPLLEGPWSAKGASIAAMTSFLARPIDSPSFVSSLSCFVVGLGLCTVRLKYENICLGRYGLRTLNFSHKR